MNESNHSKSAILLITLTLLGRVTGLFREMVLSYVYGTSGMSDAYSVAVTFSTVIFAGIAVAILNGYIPSAVSEAQRGKLLSYTSGMLKTTAMVACLLVACLLMSLPLLIRVMARGFSAETFSVTIQLSRYIVLAAPLLCFIELFAGYLQIKGHFWALPLQSITENCVLIGVFLVSAEDVNRIGVGYVLALVVPLLVIVWSSKRNGFHLVSPQQSKEKVAETWRLIFPTLGIQFATLVNSVVDRSFASTLSEGTVSSLRYASLLCDVVVSVFAVSISMVRYPQIAMVMEKGDKKKTAEAIVSTLDTLLLLIIPIAGFLVCGAYPVIKLMFERGAFTAQNTAVTSVLLRLYAFSILSASIQEFLARVFLAAKESKTLLAIQAVYVFLNICLNGLLIKLWGAEGLAAATSIASVFSAAFMLILLKRWYPTLDLKTLGLRFIKSAAAVGAFLVAGFAAKAVISLESAGLFGVCAFLLGSGISAVVIYIACLTGLRDRTLLSFLRQPFSLLNRKQHPKQQK